MRLLELEIKNIRGIKHLTVKPAGDNLVIWGPNGSGKSAVVDSIDFLLTGRIQHLTGSGTRDITLSKHGSHIDHTPKDTWVRAIIQLPNSKKQVELKRCMHEPNKLKYNINGDKEIHKVLMFAEQGLHILSRREILKYITANSNTRAQEIQELLNIGELEDTRKALVKVKNNFITKLSNLEHTVEQTKSRINATVQETIFEETKVLGVINKNRKILGSPPILKLHSKILKNEVTHPKLVAIKDGLNLTVLERDVQNIIDVMSVENTKKLEENDKQMRRLIREVQANPNLMRTLKQVQLIKLGITMIDETSRCPLCEKEWAPGELLDYLKKRIHTAEKASQYYDEIVLLNKAIRTSINNTIASLQKIIAVVKVTKLKDQLEILETWFQDLQKLLEALESVIDGYLETGFSTDKVKKMLAPDNIVEVLANVKREVKEKYPASSPEQTAWDILTRLEENLRSLENAQTNRDNIQLCLKRGSILLERFLSARDKILGELYTNIKDRFVNLYKKIHIDDESEFDANIQPEDAGLKFEVDFYGRGVHPPHALHSEGHQDSMGLCLYLALNENLTKGLIDLVILDDVVMSVDVGHRKQVCQLLANSFSDRQFLITTHDKTWTNQLKYGGVVKSKNSIEFYNWSIGMGPQVNDESDIWRGIEEDLKKDDVASASQKLRRGSEDFFGNVCDKLQATVKYNLAGRYALGDFLPAAMKQYRTLIKKAKVAEQSWGNKGAIERLQEIDSTVGQIYTRCGAEQWSLNANVHYNNWANFGKNDFRPVVEAFQDLYGIFLCSNCGSIVYVATKGFELASLRCNCGSINWNLTTK